MGKQKRVNNQLKDWLRTNRHGKLHPEQWLSLVTEPLITLGFLMIPLLLFMVIRPLPVVSRFYRVGGRFVVPGLVIALIIVLLLRARRYARLPVRYEALYSGPNKPGMFRPVTMYHANGTAITFMKKLTPGTPYGPDEPFMVYYFDDRGGKLLLSFGPADHPDAPTWEPTERYHTRLAKRT